MSMSLRAIHHSCARRSPARPPAHVRRFLPGRLGRYASSAIATSVGRAYRPNQPGCEVIVGFDYAQRPRADLDSAERWSFCRKRARSSVS